MLPNAVADSELPSWSIYERGEVRAPEPTEVMQLLRVAAEGCVDVRVAVFVRLLAATGMRRGEALGLKWESVDLEAATLKVELLPH